MRTQNILLVGIVMAMSCSASFGEQGYGDDSAEYYMNVWSTSSGGAVQITPESYPCCPTNIRLYSDAMPEGSEVTVQIWDDDGPGGTPGTMLDGKRVVLVPTETPGWIDIDISEKLVVVEQGSLYVGFGGSDRMEYSNGVDIGEPNSGRSWEYHTNCVGGRGWYPFDSSENLMVRVDYSYARQDGPVENISKQKKYRHITHAVLDAEPGDEIVVSEGVYKEQVNFFGKGIVVRSRCPQDDCVVAATVIEGKPGDPVVVFENGEIADSKLCGFTITGGGIGVFSDRSSGQIINCRIENNLGEGIEIWYKSRASRTSLLVTNCTIINNDGSGAVVAARFSEFTNCAIIGNKGGGIKYGDSKVTNCTIVGNGEYGLYGGHPVVTNCIIWDNLGGQIELHPTGGTVTYCNVQGGYDGIGNIDHDPCFVMPGGWQAEPDAPAPAPNEPNLSDYEPNLVGWWRFDEGQGSVAHDSGIYGNDGELTNGISWVQTSVGGYALDFVDARVLIPDSTELRDVNELSVSAWINYPVPQDFYNRIAAKGSDNYETFSMEIEEDRFIFSIRENDGSRYSVWSWRDIDHNEWVHVAGTYDGLAQSCYIDGELQGYSMYGQLDISRDTEGLGIGNAPDVERPFVGMIDEVRFYNVGLSEAEVVELYESGLEAVSRPTFDYGGDHHIAGGSACIDAGDNNCVPQDHADLDGDGNTTEVLPLDLDDMSRCVDYPHFPDTGNGIGPKVDIGAYEAFLPPLEVQMRFTPQAINPCSRGNWIKAHLLLPEGLTIEDVNSAVPLTLQPYGIEADSVRYFKRSGFVEIQADFDRNAFCQAGTFDGTVSVMGMLNNGQAFIGTDLIKVVTNNFEHIRTLAESWLHNECGPPNWCNGADTNRDSIVNFKDLASFEGCCIEAD